MDLEAQLRRFDQQLAAFEKLHTDELKRLEEKLTAYARLQADEIKLLREQLAELRKELAAQQEAAIPAPGSVHPSLSRREFLSGATGHRQT